MVDVALLHQAASELKTVSFNYVDAKGVPSTRTGIEPYSIKEGKFFGFDPYSQHGPGIRAFKLEQMENVQLLEQTFVPRWEIGPI
jgi:predicted DNA-binding transcriptional regulator YafY